MKETLTFSGNATNNERSAVQRRLPHELRRQKRTERERLYFKYMSERIRHDPDQLQCAIERVHRPSKETFVEQYMKPRKPAILTGMMDNWEAMKSWSFDKLGSILTKGVKVDIMENTTPYSQWNEFRALFADMYKDPAQVIMTDFHQIYPELMDAINFPKFSKDYFEEVVDEDIRPPQLSFEMAPTRSGFHWRVESLNASLWSALIQGKKLWGLYPPSKYYVPGVNHNNHRTQNSQQSESFTWWIYTKPELQDEHKPQECLQEAGEILYIPSGWWWSNVNVDDTITMQKSFCDETNIRSCMDELKELGDSVADNFHADVYIQLRNYLAIHDPGFLTDDDRQFKSPIRDLGQTNSDHGENFHQNVWKKYFEEGIDDAKFSSNRDDEANV